MVRRAIGPLVPSYIVRHKSFAGFTGKLHADRNRPTGQACVSPKRSTFRGIPRFAWTLLLLFTIAIDRPRPDSPGADAATKVRNYVLAAADIREAFGKRKSLQPRGTQGPVEWL
jgi:hypothetical protein